MAVSTIIETSGSATANSFASLAEVTQYLEDRLNSALWSAASADDQNISLLEATRELTRLKYEGNRTDTVQALSWPRAFAENPDLPDSDDGLGSITYYGDTVIPQRIKNATAELAMEFIKAGSTDIAGRDTAREISRKKVDVLETEWVGSNGRPTGLNRFPRVMQEIVSLLDKSASSSGSLRIVRG